MNSFGVAREVEETLIQAVVNGGNDGITYTSGMVDELRVVQQLVLVEVVVDGLQLQVKSTHTSAAQLNSSGAASMPKPDGDHEHFNHRPEVNQRGLQA